jgi:hypothetical protein
MQALELERNLIDAQERYYLITGNYTSDFNALDITFPSLPITSNIASFNWEKNAIIGNNDIALINNTKSASAKGVRFMAFLRTGKYAGGTFIYFVRGATENIAPLQRGKIYCAQVYNPPSAAHTNNFCQNIMDITVAPISYASANYYAIS